MGEQQRSLAKVAVEIGRVRDRLTAVDFTAATGVELRTELRELVVTCRAALSRDGLLFRFNGFLRMADRECLRHSDRLCAGDVRGAWTALTRATGYLERCTAQALRAHPGAANRPPTVRAA